MTVPSLPSTGAVVSGTKKFLRDLTERVLWTFLATVAALVSAAGPLDMLSLGFWKSVLIAGLTAVVTFLKGVAAKVIGNSDSASTDPKI